MEKGRPGKRLEISLLGDIEVRCDGVRRPLPKSRKTRGLLAYLALTGRQHRRDALCGLFWDLPNDPRAALRWSLSKLRSVLETGGESALLADQRGVALDAGLIAVDILELISSTRGRKGAQTTLEEIRARYREARLPDLELLAGWRRATPEISVMGSSVSTPASPKTPCRLWIRRSDRVLSIRCCSQ